MQLGAGHALLLHRVALTHGHRVVVERVKIDRDAERRTDLVLPPVATADGARVVEINVPVLAQLRGDLARKRRERLDRKSVV